MAYLLGGVAISIAAAADALPLERVPLAVAACLLVCAVACGRDDGPWGAAVVLALVGAAVLVAERGWGGLTPSPALAAAVGGSIGLLLVLLLDARGVAVGIVATAAAVAGTVAVMAARDNVPALGRPLSWGLIVFLLGAVNLLLWARDREVGLTGPRR